MYTLGNVFWAQLLSTEAHVDFTSIIQNSRNERLFPQFEFFDEKDLDEAQGVETRGLSGPSKVSNP